MKRIIVITVAIFISSISFAQEECGTEQYRKYSNSINKISQEDIYLPPWYGNNKFLYDILEKKGFNKQNEKTTNKSFATCDNPINYLVPLDIVRWYDNNGTNESFSASDMYDVLERVNEIYRDNNTSIQFYIRHLYTGKNTLFNNNISNNTEAALLWASHSNAIVVNLIRRDGFGYAGLSVPPDLPIFTYHLYVKRQNSRNIDIDPMDIASTLAHELGHTLGLEHTHYAGSFITYR